MNEDKAGTGMKMAANSSLHHARVEQKGYPCLLALGWLGLIFITFVAGACGPSVLETGAYGSLFNASNNMGVRFGDTDGFMEGDDYVNEDGTITHVHKNAVKASMLFFDYTPHVYKQFFRVQLHMLHPGYTGNIGAHLGEVETEDGHTVSIPEPVTVLPYRGYVYSKDDSASWEQNWAVVEVHDKEEVWKAKLEEGLKVPSMKVRKSKIKCHARSKWCSPAVMFEVDHIRWDSYYFTTSVAYDMYAPEPYSDTMKNPYKITIETMNADYTSFEMGFKYFFIVVTVLVAFLPKHGYLFCVLRARADHLSHQHFWILAMLVGLIIYNEPLMMVRVFSPIASDALSKFSMFTSTVYIAFLMYYWLVLLDDCRMGSDSGWQTMTFKVDDTRARRMIIFYAPKLVLILVIWSLTFASYCVYAFQDEYDSSYQVVDGSMTASTYKNLAIATCFFMSIYMLWTLILFCMVVFKSCALPVPYKWLFGLSSFTLLMVIIGTFVGIAYPVPSAAFIFVGFYGVINAYVWIMAIAWAPMDIDGGVLGHDAEVEMGNKQRPLSSSTSSTMNETASPFDQGAAEDNFSSLPEATDEERGASEFD